jgi:hypothetical protein
LLEVEVEEMVLLPMEMQVVVVQEVCALQLLQQVAGEV